MPEGAAMTVGLRMDSSCRAQASSLRLSLSLPSSLSLLSHLAFSNHSLRCAMMTCQAGPAAIQAAIQSTYIRVRLFAVWVKFSVLHWLLYFVVSCCSCPSAPSSLPPRHDTSHSYTKRVCCHSPGLLPCAPSDRLCVLYVRKKRRMRHAELRVSQTQGHCVPPLTLHFACVPSLLAFVASIAFAPVAAAFAPCTPAQGRHVHRAGQRPIVRHPRLAQARPHPAHRHPVTLGAARFLELRRARSPCGRLVCTRAGPLGTNGSSPYCAVRRCRVR